MKIFGLSIKFKRRRYGNSETGTTFTWASVTIGGEQIQLGDPWPVKSPPVAELERAVSAALAAHDAKPAADPLGAELAAIGARWDAAIEQVRAELN